MDLSWFGGEKAVQEDMHERALEKYRQLLPARAQVHIQKNRKKVSTKVDDAQQDLKSKLDKISEDLQIAYQGAGGRSANDKLLELGVKVKAIDLNYQSIT